MTTETNITTIWLKGYGWYFVHLNYFNAHINVETIRFFRDCFENVNYNRN